MNTNPLPNHAWSILGWNVWGIGKHQWSSMIAWIFDRGVGSALSLSPLRRAFERSLAYEQIRQNRGRKPALLLPLLMLLTKTSVNEFFLWNKIMCFLVFTSHSSLLLFHLNKNFERNFAHNTTTWWILSCSFLPNPYIISYVFKDIFGTSNEYKNKNRVDICPKTNAFWKFKWFLK